MLKVRALKEEWNIAAVIPVEKGAVGGGGGHHQKHGAPKQQQHHRKLESNGSSISDVSLEENNFLGICSQELLKRTRKGDPPNHLCTVSIRTMDVVVMFGLTVQVLCSLHWKVVSVYINRMGLVNESLLLHLLEDGEHRRYFGLRTAEHRVIDFECTVHQPAGVRDVDQGRGAAADAALRAGGQCHPPSVAC
jgi:hypothetical protein